ncbi:MAG: DUF362 domain-containing protein [Sorangiineae bacterium]|nr:DUF362 domain-containing protein [Polyangiaceae bacterium]MEB2323333.1 DUF362 domain-containing protein [Sorangiineae bacterium]
MSTTSRRTFLEGAGAFGAALLAGQHAHAEVDPITALIARPPAGFSPMAAPGKVVKVTKSGDFASLMQPNQLWPKPEVARHMLEKGLTAFTGAPNVVEAMKKFIHKDDVVAIKVNGIALDTLATNFEVVLPVVEAVLGVGVPADKITVYEQYPTFLWGTRVGKKGYVLPAGVKTATHNNANHPMPDIRVYQGIKTRYSRFLTEATAVINISMIKHHSICGYTGLMKNMTHGNVNNPEDHHAHAASPQIAMLYNHPIVTSRQRLNITDGFKVKYDLGPLDKQPATKTPHGAIYVSTDPVAMDSLGWKIVDDERKERKLKLLSQLQNAPRYIETAAELGLGVRDLNQIRLQTVEA